MAFSLLWIDGWVSESIECTPGIVDAAVDFFSADFAASLFLSVVIAN